MAARLLHRRYGGLAGRPDTFEEEQLADFGAVEMREKGMVGAAMGTTALSAKRPLLGGAGEGRPVTRFVLIDTAAETPSVFLERDTIGHPQFCPDDDDLILYAGPLTDRVWVTDRSGTKNRRLYAREDRMQWVTHEVWVPGRRAVAFVDWPRGTRLIDVDSGVVRWITRFPAWHAAPDDDGRALRLRHQLSRTAACTSTTSTTRPTLNPLAPSEARTKAPTGAARFPTTTGRSAVEARAAYPSASALPPDDWRRAVHLGPDRPRAALRSHAGGRRNERERVMLESQRVAPKSAPAGSPAPAAAWRTASSSAIRDPAEGLRLRLPALLPAQPRACPVLEVTDPAAGAEEAAHRRPAYRLRALRVYLDGERVGGRPTSRPRRDDPVSFLIGSASASTAGWSAPACRPTRTAGAAHELPAEPAGPFRGDIIVTMRWLPPQQPYGQAGYREIPFNHGAPIDVGDPARSA